MPATSSTLARRFDYPRRSVRMPRAAMAGVLRGRMTWSPTLRSGVAPNPAPSVSAGSGPVPRSAVSRGPTSRREPGSASVAATDRGRLAMSPSAERLGTVARSVCGGVRGEGYGEQ